MASKNPCGHPADWVATLNAGGKRYTYCLGCLFEKTGIRHLQTYDNPYMKYGKVVNSAPVVETVVSSTAPVGSTTKGKAKK